MGKGLRMTEAEVAAHQRRLWGNGLGFRSTGRAAATVLRRVLPESKLELRFTQQLAERPDIPPHVRNYFFLDGRDFELDFAWPNLKFAVSIEGMAHRVRGRFKADIEKHALAVLAGWTVLRVGGAEIRHGVAIYWTQTMLERPR